MKHQIHRKLASYRSIANRPPLWGAADIKDKIYLEKLMRLYWYASFPVSHLIKVPVSSIHPFWYFDPSLVENRARAYVEEGADYRRVAEWERWNDQLGWTNLFFLSYQLQGYRVLLPKIEPLPEFTEISLPNVTLVWVVQPETCAGLDCISRDDIVSSLPFGLKLTEVPSM